MNEINYNELEEYTLSPKKNFEEIKKEIEPLVVKLYNLKAKKTDIDAELQALKIEKMEPVNSEISEVKKQIRNMIDPYVQGDQWRVGFGDLNLTSKKTTNVSIKSKDQIISWMEGNEYKEVMTWDINTNKAAAILRNEYEKNGIMVDGAEYTQFTVVDVK